MTIIIPKMKLPSKINYDRHSSPVLASKIHQHETLGEIVA